jgi:hypothetical protein
MVKKQDQANKPVALRIAAAQVELEKCYPEIAQLRQAVDGNKTQSPLLFAFRPRGIRGGNTAKYETAADMLQAVDMYAEHCYMNKRPMSLIGMARCLGFSAWNHMQEYGGPAASEHTPSTATHHLRDPAFAQVILYAKGLVENWLVTSMLDGTAPLNGAKFLLASHFGYSETADSTDRQPLTIRKDFIESLGSGGAVVIKKGDEKKEQGIDKNHYHIPNLVDNPM